MIEIDKCKIGTVLNKQESHIKAFVMFLDGGVRLGGFLVKDGPHGLYLDAPKISRRYIYFDENKTRWAKVQARVLEEYKKLCENASTDDIRDLDSENEEIDLDKVPF